MRKLSLSFDRVTQLETSFNDINTQRISKEEELKREITQLKIYNEDLSLQLNNKIKELTAKTAQNIFCC